MQNHNFQTKSNRNSLSVSAQARLLVSKNRQKQQNRHQSMLQRAATEVGLDD